MTVAAQLKVRGVPQPGSCALALAEAEYYMRLYAFVRFAGLTSNI